MSVASSRRISIPPRLIDPTSIIECVDQIPIPDSARAVALKLCGDLYRSAPLEGEQNPEMGRGFYVECPDGGVINLKGAVSARTPAVSEVMNAIRARMPANRRHLCFGNGTPYDTHVGMRVDDESRRCHLTYVEYMGYSPFSVHVYDHLMTQVVYGFENVYVAPSLMVASLEPEPAPEGCGKTGEEFRAYLAQRANREISVEFPEYADYEIDATSLVWPNSVPPFEPFRGGMQARYFDDPSRLQHLVDLMTDGWTDQGQWSKLKDAYPHLDGIMGSRKWEDVFVERLANTAATMFQKGIVHGQLSYRWQNVTVTGALCDFDSTVVLPAINPDLDSLVRAELSNADARHAVDTHDRYERYVSRFPTRDAQLAASAFQIYALWGTVLRANDLAHRSRGRSHAEFLRMKDRNVAMPLYAREDLLRRFSSEFLENLDMDGRRLLKEIGLQLDGKSTDFCTELQAIVRDEMDLAFPNPLAWERKGRLADFRRQQMSDADRAFVVGEVLSLIEGLNRTMTAGHSRERTSSRWLAGSGNEAFDLGRRSLGDLDMR